MKLLDASHPFFNPLWRRIAVVVFALGWAAFEYSLGETVWALFFGAIGLYCAWALLLAYEPAKDEQGKEG